MKRNVKYNDYIIKKKSQKLISEKFVKRAIIKWLSRNGFWRNLQYGDLREKCVDIKVQNNKYGVYFWIFDSGYENMGKWIDEAVLSAQFKKMLKKPL